MGPRLPWWHWLIRQFSLVGVCFFTVEIVILAMAMVMGSEDFGTDLHLELASIVLVTCIPGMVYAVLTTIVFAICHLERHIFRALGITVAVTWVSLLSVNWIDFNLGSALIGLLPTGISTLVLWIYLRLLHYFDRPRPSGRETRGLDLVHQEAQVARVTKPMC